MSKKIHKHQETPKNRTLNSFFQRIQLGKQGGEKNIKKEEQKEPPKSQFVQDKDKDKKESSQFSQDKDERLSKSLSLGRILKKNQPKTKAFRSIQEEDL